jgi:hypothetical protein
MLQLLKRFLCFGLLAFGLQTSWAFSLLGPSATYPGVPATFGDPWQVETIGFNPIPTYDGAPPYIGIDPLAIGPKNIGEGYRRNTPVIYYAFDQNFATFFGVNGEQAVDQAFAILNALTNVDSYSSNLVEFPLQSQSQNYRATTLELRDLKSTTLALMMEQMGLADAIRYTWILHNRYHETGAGLPPCPADMVYQVVMRNFDIVASPLNQLQYSAYVNGELYTYYIPVDLCGTIPAPPDADAVEVSADHLTRNYPVASGGFTAEGSLGNGFFYTSLTRDDVAGLRTLYSSNNINMESAAPNSTALSGGGGVNGQPFNLTTTSLAILSFTDPVTLQALVPGIVIDSVATNLVNGQTNYVYTFGNLVTYSSSTNTPVRIQVQTTTTTIAPPIGAPYGSPAITNTTTTATTATNQENLLSGDFYIVPTNSCGLTVLGVVATNVTTVINFLGTVTNTPILTTTVVTSTNLIITSTNHVLSVTLCTNAPGTTTGGLVGKFQGIERIQFVRVPDQNIDPLTGNFYQPITTTNTMMVVPPNSSQVTAQKFQRVLPQPDILFSAADLLPGPAAVNSYVPVYDRNVNFNLIDILPGLAGPGTINPLTIVTFDKVGPVLQNISPSTLNEANAGLLDFVWGSFDGSTNDPTVYPNGTSIATLESEALIQIYPPTLPDGTNGTSYYYYTNVVTIVGTNVVTSVVTNAVTLSVTGGGPSYTWSLASGSSGLPTNLNLSPGGVISGTPNQSGTFDFTVQMNDSSARSVQMNYSITIH